MPLLSPQKDEEKSDFVSRCMGDGVMNKEFPKNDQRAAVCYSQWEKKENDEMSKKAVVNELKQVATLLHKLDLKKEASGVDSVIEKVAQDQVGATLLGKITGFLQQKLPEVDYDTALEIAVAIEDDLKTYDWIALRDGITYEKSFTPKA